MYLVKRLRMEDTEMFAGLTTPAIRQLLSAPQPEQALRVFGAFAWPSPIGLAVVELGRGQAATLRSVAVAAAYRNQGVGSSLLEKLEEYLAAQGYRSVGVSCLPTEHPAPAFSALLRKNQYSELEPAGIFCESDFTTLTQAPWMKHCEFPNGFEPFPWVSLTASERAGMLTALETTPWFPAHLSPFRDEARLHLCNSVGLRYRGEVIGWCIAHRAGSDGVSCHSLFVREQFQSRGHAIRLLAYSIWKTEGSGATRFFFNVGNTMGSMMNFFHKHMAPYMTSVRTLHVSAKTLAGRPLLQALTP